MPQDRERQAILCRIANAAMAITSEMLAEDQQFTPSLRGPNTRSRQIYREDFITARIAVELTKRFSAHVDFRLFSTGEENLNGADWYWHIQVGDYAMHARVQAKRIARKNIRQPDDDGFIEIESNQLRDLIRSVTKAQAKLPLLESWIATYARINAYPPCHVSPAKCRQHGCGGTCAQTSALPSIWIAQASTLVQNEGFKRKQLPIRDIVHDSIRLDCMLPCIQSQDGSGPGLKGFGLSRELLSFDDAVAVISNNSAMAGKIAGALNIRI